MKTRLVLIPGLLNDGELWCYQIEGLSDIVDCIISDITHALTMSEMAKAVFEVAPDSPCALAGFSLGGFVAQEMLRQHAGCIARLALICTDYLPDTAEQAHQRRQVIEAARIPGRFIGISHQMLKAYLHPDHWNNEEMTSRVQDMTGRLGADVLIQQNSVTRNDASTVLRAFHGPTTTICGENDRIQPVAISKAMAALMPQAWLVIVPHAGHLVTIEQPQAVNDALRQWLMQ